MAEKLTVAEAARRLGVNAKTLRKWKRKYHPAPTPAIAPTPSVEQEHRRLREENRQLKMERGILPLNASIAVFFLSPGSSFLPWPGAFVLRIGT